MSGAANQGPAGNALGIAALNNIASNIGKLITQTALAIVVPITQGGTGASSAAAARTNLGIGNIGAVQLGSLLAANMNSVADQPISLTLPGGISAYALNAIVVTNPTPSGAISAAVGGIYTAPAAGGVAIVGASQAYSGLTTNAANTAGSILFLTIEQTVLLTVNTLYLHLSTPQGSAITADFRVYGMPLY